MFCFKIQALKWFDRQNLLDKITLQRQGEGNAKCYSFRASVIYYSIG